MIASSLIEIAQKTRQSSRQLALLSGGTRNQALEAIAQALELNQAEIIAANQTDLQEFKDKIPQPIYDRLKLDETKLLDGINGIRQVKKLENPVGKIQIYRALDDELILKRVTCPLGVLGVVFEARPDALIQITSLAIKSGNGAILKPGKEAIGTCQALMIAIYQGLAKTNVNPDILQLITTRAEIDELLKLDEYVDLIIPRGSNSFVRYVQDNTRIPVLGHADGICHLYIDKEFDIEKAINITVDSKTQYPAACNAIETLLVYQDIADVFLPEVAAALETKNVKLKGDEATQKIINVIPATEEDWKTEYSDLILSVKIVNSLDEAINHINTYGSKHTDGIVTENIATAETFLNQVNSANVYHNCSTRFSDGFRYGFGAEVGISTQKMPPRGPVGLEGLVTYKYQLVGNGQIVATYNGKNAKPFIHKDLL